MQARGGESNRYAVDHWITAGQVRSGQIEIEMEGTLNHADNAKRLVSQSIVHV
jgi:hypothetical protein